MNRTLVLCIAICFAMIGLAMMTSDASAGWLFHGHGCGHGCGGCGHGCGGSVAAHGCGGCKQVAHCGGCGHRWFRRCGHGCGGCCNGAAGGAVIESHKGTNGEVPEAPKAEPTPAPEAPKSTSTQRSVLVRTVSFRR